jgi:hypothetical protein
MAVGHLLVDKRKVEITIAVRKKSMTEIFTMINIDSYLSAGNYGY